MTDPKTISTDHDTIIRLETKMDSVASDIKEIKDGNSAKMAESDGKHIALALRVKKLEDDVLVAKTNVGAFRVIGGAIGGGIVFLLTQIPNIIKSWGMKI
jgi:uncharacterized protein (UPF0335 family)